MEVAAADQPPPAVAPRQQRQPPPPSTITVNKLQWFKLILVLVLLLTCFVLQLAVYTLEVTVAELKQQQQQQQKNQRGSGSNSNSNNQKSQSSSSASSSSRQQQQFVQHAAPNQFGELASHHDRSQQPYTTTQQQQPTAAAQHHWNQVLAWGLLNWAQDDGGADQQQHPFPEPDVAVPEDQKTAHALRALQQAADLGHPEAQFYLANSLAAGFWTVAAAQPPTTNTNNNNNNWTVTDAWLWQDDSSHASSSSNSNNAALQQQQTTSWLLYRMAAQGGHVEAALALAYRLELAHAHASPLQLTTTASPADGGGGGSNNKKDSTAAAAANTATTPTSQQKQQQQRHCAARLPYYAAAAHATVDQLLLDEQSRGWVLPPRDRHVLHQVHLHGGTGSRLDGDNRPSESSETLQFYHVRAAALLQFRDRDHPSSSSDDDDDPDDSSNSHSINDIDDATTAAAAAAFTLARYHHLGLRGVVQNCTAAAYYYELAASAGHWEAAGQAGTLHLWGVGVPQNAWAAHQWFRHGLGGGPLNLHRHADLDTLLEHCQERHRQRLQQQQQQKSSSVGSGDRIYLCDDASLNGMGLLHLWGVPAVGVPVDRKTALDYLTLARDQGSADAAYHLAMTRLGWKTHHRTIRHLEENGSSTNGQAAEDLFPPHGRTADGDKPMGHLTPSEYQRVLTDLTTAASKNHLLARHRLALLYEDGVTIPKVRSGSTSGSTSGVAAVQVAVVPQDCPKALQHYRWVVDHGHRASGERLRRAYRQYMAGDYAASLRNYLVASETGHELAQANAAFLMEQGTCLGLGGAHSSRDCAAAAVRLWKAAAQKQQHRSAEASLRVGDFYYYGRFRGGDRNGGGDDRNGGSGGGSGKEAGLPFGWLPRILYPERYLLPAVWDVVKRGILRFSVWEPLSVLDLPSSKSKQEQQQQQRRRQQQQQQENNEPSATCGAPDSESSEPGTCAASDDAAKEKSDSDSDGQHSLEQDLAMAVHYYRQAADQGGNPRGHFNLGFMYEWGLGVKQDFPLAKREYDLALSNSGVAQEADLPVTLALWALGAHEWTVKLYRSWQDYWQQRPDAPSSSSSSSSERIRSSSDDDSATPSPADSSSSGTAAHHGSTHESPRRREEGSQAEGRPVPGGAPAQQHPKKTKVDVILSHLFSWESLLILVLTVALSQLFKIRRTRGR